MTTLGDIVRSNGFKRPAPTLSVTALVRDLFSNNPDKRYSADDVASVVSSRDPGIERKAVGAVLSRLTGVKGDFFLAVENPNTRTVFYKLALSKTDRLKLADRGTPVTSVQPTDPLKAWVDARASVQAEYNRLNDELAVEEERYRNQRAPRMDRLVQLQRALNN